MSKQIKKTQPVARTSAVNEARNTAPAAPKASGSFYTNPYFLLSAIVFLLYAGSIKFDFTELDDTIFIKDPQFVALHESFNHIGEIFTRGLFNATTDPYYRPLFSFSMMVNYSVSQTEIWSYHLFNILFHIGNVLLVYKLLCKILTDKYHALLLAGIYGVHPVLSQAVAWIPGRNDTILALFSFSFFLKIIDYSDEKKPMDLVWSIVLLLGAFFTKETAVFLPPVGFLILLLGRGKKPFERESLVQYGAWAGVFVFWFLVRRSIVGENSMGETGQLLADFMHRSPLVIQYLGKILFPFNLSVFPILEDTVYYFGFAAIAVIGFLLALSKQVNWKIVTLGFGIFIALLIPALLLPVKLNQQTFEHRLYLPIVGILIVMSETMLFKGVEQKKLLMGTGGVGIVFAFINLFIHQPNFRDAKTFWAAAARTSPNSAYANMMLAARTQDLPTSYVLFHKAYKLDSNEKYLNYYYGVMLQKQDSVLASGRYFLKEKKISNYYECDFYLSRYAMESHDTVGAISYMEEFRKKEPGNSMACNNLLLMYITARQVDKARNLASEMQAHGMQVPPQLIQALR